MDMLRSIIEEQRRRLEGRLQEPLTRVAERLGAVWPEREALDAVLQEAIREWPECTFLYALDTGGIQVSDNISHAGVLTSRLGRDRSVGFWLGRAG